MMIMIYNQFISVHCSRIIGRGLSCAKRALLCFLRHNKKRAISTLFENDKSDIISSPQSQCRYVYRGRVVYERDDLRITRHTDRDVSDCRYDFPAKLRNSSF